MVVINSLEEIMILIVKFHDMEIEQRCTNINKKLENANSVTKERNFVLHNNERVH